MDVQVPLISEQHTRRDLRQLETAIRHWEIPDKVLETVPSIMARIIASGSNREKIAATKVLVAMHNSNQPVLNAHVHQHQIASRGSNVEMSLDERRKMLIQRVAAVDLAGRNK